MTTPNIPRSPVKYVVLERSLIGNEIREVGATVSYDGLPAENLQPTCDEGKARYAEYLQSNAERLAKLKAENPDTAGFGTDFAKQVAAAIAEANAAADARVAAVLASLPGAIADALKAAAPTVDAPVPETPAPVAAKGKAGKGDDTPLA